MAVSATTPQGLHAITLGYSRTSGDSADAYNSYVHSSDVTVSLLASLGPNAVAIGGRAFIVDTSFEPYRREAFRHKTLPAQRQSINLTNISGEGTINTDGLWRREQIDWSMGAGQKYLDRRTESASNRFYASKGVDVFANTDQATLLNATRQVKASVATNLQITNASSQVFVIDDGTVAYSTNINAATPTWTTFTSSSFITSGGFTAPSVFNALDSNDSYVFLATDTGIWQWQIGVSTQWACYAKPDASATFTGYNLVRWCNDRVVAAAGNWLYCFATSHSVGAVPGAADKLVMNPNSAWWWSDACGGSSAIYVAGYTKTSTGNWGGTVYRCSVTVGATSVTVNAPVQALPMSPDEYPTRIQNYLNFVFVGTNRGIRMCQTLNAYDPTATGNGDLKAGPLIPNLTHPVTLPVRAITGDGRFVWFGWSNYDSQSTGLGRLDLSTNIAGDTLTPAYQSDYMVDGAGEILDMTWEPISNRPLFAVSGKGFYTVDTSKYVTQGNIQTGSFAYGIPDHKIPVFFDYGVDMPDTVLPTGATSAYVNATLTTEPFDPSQKVTIFIPAASEGQSEVSVPSGSSYKAEAFQVQVNINSDSTQATTPTLYRWTLKSWPAAVSEAQIMVPVQLHTVNVTDGLETYVDPYEAFMYFENLRTSQAIVTYQEGTLTANVVVDTIDWIPHKRQGNYENGFEGDCVVTLKTIGGYNPYPGFPTK